MPIAVGAVCGLAWSASLRGWMIQIAGDESSFNWLGTFGLILLPGAVLGALLGWAADLQLNGNLSPTRQRWLMASPLVLAAALFDPRIFHLLITNGQGAVPLLSSSLVWRAPTRCRAVDPAPAQPSRVWWPCSSSSPAVRLPQTARH